jgi:hypothetical protein
MNNNSAVVTVIAVVLLIAALYFLVQQFRGPSVTIRPKWFYCLQEERLFLDKQDLIPPIESPWGGEAVQAVVYFCGDCDQEPTIKNLLTFTPEAKAEQEKQRKLMEERGAPSGMWMDPMRQVGGQLVSAVDEIEWVNAMQAGDLLRQMPTCDDGSKPIYSCFPKRYTKE